jgi:PAS domain S-box-containing protein
MKAPLFPNDEPERLLALQRYGVLDTPADAGFDALTRLAAHALQVPVALVSLVDADRQWFKSRYGLEVEETSREISFCGHVVGDGLPLVVEDAANDRRFADNPLVTGDPRVRFYAGFPLRTPDGFILGTLCAIDTEPRTPDRRELEVLELLASQASAQLELVRRSRELAVSEGRLRAVLETATDSIILIDESGEIFDANPAVEANFGHRAADLLGENIRLLMPEEMRHAHDHGMGQYLQTGRKKVIGRTRELIGMRKDGSTFPIDAMVSEAHIAGKRMFTGILRDATLRKDAEDKLQETLLELRKSRDDLLGVFGAVPIGVLALGQDGRVAFANDAAAALCGVAADLAVGKHWTDVLGVHESRRASELRELLASPDAARSPVSLRLQASSSARTWVEVHARDDPRDDERRILFLYDVSEVHELSDELARRSKGQMIGKSPAMLDLFAQIQRVARGDWSVLITGETGAGKELVARAIHAASDRRRGPFVAVNCSGLTESLLGSQLFGHTKGAFTGAFTDQPGLFEAAEGGTLFLDEVGDISAPVQSTLLRVLEEREITRIGETKPRSVNVRILSATHRDLADRARQGLFRRDLLYRIRRVRVQTPALRERRDDISLLVDAFLADQRLNGGTPVAQVSDASLERLTAYDWPGNVRELRATIEHLAVHCENRCIEVDDLPPEILGSSRGHGPAVAGVDERSQIVRALRSNEGNRTKAAKALGMSRATLYRRLAALGIGRGESQT